MLLEFVLFILSKNLCILQQVFFDILLYTGKTKLYRVFQNKECLRSDTTLLFLKPEKKILIKIVGMRNMYYLLQDQTIIL